MTTSLSEVIGIGFANIDAIAEVGYDTLERHGLKVGVAQAVDHATLQGLISRLNDVRSRPGGSVANTLSAMAGRGWRSCYYGVVGADPNGQEFIQSLRSHGVDCPIPPLDDGTPTTVVLVLVTPDGAQSFVYCPAASYEFEANMIDAKRIANSAMLVLESFMLDGHLSAFVFRHSADLALASRRAIALNLNDPELVARHRGFIGHFIESHCQIVVGNIEEYYALLGTRDLDAVVAELTAYSIGKNKLLAVTLGARGAVVVNHGISARIPAVQLPPGARLHSTGAGDHFAAGLLTGYLDGLSLDLMGQRAVEQAARIMLVPGGRLAS